MSVQNNYNNYIKRQAQKSSNNNFKEKVANSLAGKTVNNTTATTTTRYEPTTGFEFFRM